MADNVQANAGSGGAIFKTDEVGGVHTPISKVAFGVDGTVTTVDASNPLPVSVASAVVSGEVALDSATLSALETVQVGNFPTTQPISGSVSVSNFPTSQPVTGTFWQATQPVSGTVTANTGLSQPLTDTQLRSTPVPISGSVTTGGITDTQLRATAVPISGTVTANTGLTQPLTDAQLRAADVKVSLDGEMVAITAAVLPLPSGAATEATITSSDQLLDELVFILQSILEKMPRVTGNDQAAVSVEAGSLSTVSTVTTCGTLTTVSQIGTRSAMTAADAMIMQGTSHIYNNLVVS